MKKSYVVPEAEIVEVLVEQGFAASGVETMSISGSINGDGWEAGEEI